MSGLDLEESAWHLAKANAGGVLASASFNLATGSASAMTAAIVGWLSYGGEALKVGLLSAAAGIGVYLLCFSAVIVFQWVAAPVRQRNELRRAFRNGDRLGSGEIAARISDYRRRGEDLLQGCKASGGYTAGQEEEVGRWTGEVAVFLASCFPDGRAAIDFSRASQGTMPLVGRLENRIAALDGLVESLVPRPVVASSSAPQI